jgi:hypothetical protein
MINEAKIKLMRDAATQAVEEAIEAVTKCGCCDHVWSTLEAAYFASEESICDQEGCHETGQFVFKVKERVCAGFGNCGSKLKTYSDNFRQFCREHRERGDSNLEDNDDNYELVREQL